MVGVVVVVAVGVAVGVMSCKKKGYPNQQFAMNVERCSVQRMPGKRVPLASLLLRTLPAMAYYEDEKGDGNAWLIHEIQKFTEMKILLESIETIKRIVMKESRP